MNPNPLWVELLTDELHSLVAHGVTPNKLPSIPLLRELAGVPDEAGPITGASLVARYLKAEIARLEGEHRLMWRDIDVTFTADQGQRCLMISLKLGSRRPVTHRREEALVAIGVPPTIRCMETLRRSSGPLRSVLGILAEHILVGSNQPAA